MTPWDYQAANPAAALVLEHPGGERLLAAIWPDGDGAVFADTGWPTQDSSFSFHRLAGPIVPLGDPAAPVWRAAHSGGEPVLIRPLWPWEGALTAEWRAWQDYAGAHPDTTTPAAARKVAENTA